MTRRIRTLALALGAAAVALLAVHAAAPETAHAQSHITRLIRPKVVNGDLTLPNTEAIRNATDDMVTFCGQGGTADVCLRLDLDDATGAVIEARTAADAAADTLQLGAAGQNVTILGTSSIAGALTLESGESINTAADAAFDFTRNTAGAVTLTCSDDNAVAACIYDAGGAADVQLGSADATAAIVTMDNDMQVRAGATGLVEVTLHDYADTTDDDMAHARITANCTDTGTGTEDCDLTLRVVEAGAAAETRLLIDGDAGVTIGSANTDSVTLTTDGAGDAEAVLPENSVGADESAVMADSFVACGQQANTGTIYGGPALSSLNGDGAEDGIAGAVCDALDNADEGTADLPLGFANTAFKVSGMLCEVSSSGANGVVLALRSALAAITPAVTCTVATGATTCSPAVGSTTDVAAGATVAVSAVNTEDLSLQDFWCRVFIAWK